MAKEPDHADLLARHGAVSSFTFGDGPALCAELLALVRSGRKTATTGALRDYDSGEEPMPRKGERSIALNWDGTPAPLIETREVSICRFREVGEDFALAEGENHDLEGWRADHRAYFDRNGGYDPDMMVVCERFALIEDFQ